MVIFGPTSHPGIANQIFDPEGKFPETCIIILEQRHEYAE